MMVSESEAPVPADNPAPCTPTSGLGLGTLDATQASELAARFKALADPSRLQIVSIIAANPAEETCVCDLTEPLQLGQPTVSHHLKVLVEAGLLTREKRGLWAYYSLLPGALESLAESILLGA